MANSTGSVKITLSFPGPGGATIAAALSVLPSFQASSFGQVDVPDTTPSSTAFSIPFGSIAVGASLVLIQNKTGQEMSLKLNGSAALQNIPDQGVVLLPVAALPAASKLTAVSLTTTATQSGAGTIDFYVLGDPV